MADIEIITELLNNGKNRIQKATEKLGYYDVKIRDIDILRDLRAELFHLSHLAKVYEIHKMEEIVDRTIFDITMTLLECTRVESHQLDKWKLALLEMDYIFERFATSLHRPALGRIIFVGRREIISDDPGIAFSWEVIRDLPSALAFLQKYQCVGIVIDLTINMHDILCFLESLNLYNGDTIPVVGISEKIGILDKFALAKNGVKKIFPKGCSVRDVEFFLFHQRQENLPWFRKVFLISQNLEIIESVRQRLLIGGVLAKVFPNLDTLLAQMLVEKPHMFIFDFSEPKTERWVIDVIGDKYMNRIPLICIIKNPSLRDTVLRIGAQDYLLFPFHSKEFQTRVWHRLEQGFLFSFKFCPHVDLKQINFVPDLKEEHTAKKGQDKYIQPYQSHEIETPTLGSTKPDIFLIKDGTTVNKDIGHPSEETIPSEKEILGSIEEKTTVQLLSQQKEIDLIPQETPPDAAHPITDSIEEQQTDKGMVQWEQTSNTNETSQPSSYEKTLADEHEKQTDETTEPIAQYQEDTTPFETPLPAILEKSTEISVESLPQALEEQPAELVSASDTSSISSYQEDQSPLAQEPHMLIQEPPEVEKTEGEASEQGLAVSEEEKSDDLQSQPVAPSVDIALKTEHKPPDILEDEDIPTAPMPAPVLPPPKVSEEKGKRLFTATTMLYKAKIPQRNEEHLSTQGSQIEDRRPKDQGMMTKVLIIAKDRIFIELLSHQFLKRSWYVVSADDQHSAVKVLNREAFTFVILDSEAFEGEGFNILEKLKEHKKETKILFLLGQGKEQLRLKSISLGADYTMVKPASPQSIAAILARSVQTRGQ